MNWMVMAAVDLTAKNRNREKSFARNATDINSKAEAEAVAHARNKTEMAVGHSNVTWYVCEQIDFGSFQKGARS